MRTQRPRYALISKLSAKLLEEAGITKPAVPVARLLKNTGIELRYGELGDVSGLLARTKDGAIVGVNSAHAEARQRFTMAHELGHFLLHKGISTHTDRDYKVNYRDRTSSEASDVEEIEANSFAANLLMPREFLEQDQAADAIDTDEAVKRLAKRYGVSQHAMSLRLANVYGRFRPF